jgi:hypothetical protein
MAAMHGAQCASVMHCLHALAQPTQLDTAAAYIQLLQFCKSAQAPIGSATQSHFAAL